MATEQEQSEKPPIFRSWNGWYALVLGVLLLEVLLLYWLTYTFA